MSEFSDLKGSEFHHHGTGFRHLLEHLVGETVTITSDGVGYGGKLADVETRFVTLAVPASGTTAGVDFIYFPVRKVTTVLVD